MGGQYIYGALYQLKTNQNTLKTGKQSAFIVKLHTIQQTNNIDIPAFAIHLRYHNILMYRYVFHITVGL